MPTGIPRRSRPDLHLGDCSRVMPRTSDAIKAAMDAVQHHRETVQPIREKTGGSTFKNPEGTSAWKEIDKAGCRGLMIGGAQMSPMHCNFMINTGNATGYDLEYLGETVRSAGARERPAYGCSGRSSASAASSRGTRCRSFWGNCSRRRAPPEQQEPVKAIRNDDLRKASAHPRRAFLRPEFRLFLWSSCRSTEVALVMKLQRIPIGSCHGIKSLIL
jgi:hypothetical protein